jgi:hypothetical protein
MGFGLERNKVRSTRHVAASVDHRREIRGAAPMIHVKFAAHASSQRSSGSGSIGCETKIR